jgi:hypothetical protein
LQVLLLSDISGGIDAYSFSMTRKSQVDQLKYMKMRLKHPEILSKLEKLKRLLESHMARRVR